MTRSVSPFPLSLCPEFRLTADVNLLPRGQRPHATPGASERTGYLTGEPCEGCGASPAGDSSPTSGPGAAQSPREPRGEVTHRPARLPGPWLLQGGDWAASLMLCVYLNQIPSLPLCDANGF